jgi:hypothetical protein
MRARPHGVGIGLRRRHFSEVLSTSRRIDWLEIITENFVDYGGLPATILARCSERWPIVAHGVSLSVGGPDPIDPGLLGRIDALFGSVDAEWWSEHLCFAGGKGLAFHDLLPLPFTPAAVDHVTGRLRQVQARIERPLLLENITYYAEMPGATMDEGLFVRTVLEESGAGLLLDVNNVYVNAHNHRRDAFALLRALPLERVKQIHLAGHTPAPPPFEEMLYDTHGAPIADPVWALYRQALRLCGPVPTLVEWDTRIPSLDRVLDEADRARAIMAEVCGS